MANDNEILVKISADVADALSGLKSLQSTSDKAAKDISSSFEATNKTLESTSATLKVGVAGAIAAIGAAVVGTAFGALKNGLESVVSAGLEAEKTAIKFQAALSLSGDASQETRKRFEDFANSISSLTGVDDDAILSQVAFAKNLGLTNDQTEKAIKAAVDLSAATGAPLEQAVSATSKSLLGYNRELGAILPQTKGFTDAQAAAGKAVDFVTQRFQNAAETFATTLPGALKRTETTFDNLKETLGKIILQNPVVIGGINKLADLFVTLGGIVKQNEEIIKKISIAIGQFLVEAFRLAIVSIINVVSFCDRLIVAFKNIGAAASGLGDIINLTFTAIRQAANGNFDPIKNLGTAISNINDELEANAKQRLTGFEERSKVYTQIKDEVNKAAESVKHLGDTIDKTSKGKPFEVNAKVTIDIPTKKDTVEIEAKIKSLIGDLGKVGINTIEAVEKQRVERIALINKGASLGLVKGEEERTRLISQINEQAAKKQQDIVKSIYDESASSIFNALKNVFKNISKGGPEFTAALAGLGVAVVGAISKGAAGAQDAVSSVLAFGIAKALGPIGEVLGPGIKQIFDLLGQGPEKVKEFLNAFFEALPEVIKNIVTALPVLIQGFTNGLIAAIPDIILALIEAIPLFIENFIQGFIDQIDVIIVAIVDKLPLIIEALIELLPDVINVLIENVPRIIEAIVAAVPQIVAAIVADVPKIIIALVSQIPRVGSALVSEMPKVALNFIQELVKNVPTLVKEMVKEIGNQFKSLGGLLGGGGGSGGGGGGVIGAVTGFIGGIGKKLGFADGGLVPGTLFTGDKVISGLNSGELVIDRGLTGQLENFLNNQVSDSSDKNGVAAPVQQADRGQVFQLNLNIGEEQLANVLLDLNQRGFRTA